MLQLYWEDGTMMLAICKCEVYGTIAISGMWNHDIGNSSSSYSKR